MSEFKTGDEVLYTPHMCHAFHRDISGDYAWEIGVRENPGNPDPELRNKIKVLSARQLADRLEYARRLPADQGELVMSKLVCLRPVRPWRAVVRSANQDGTLTLDITSPQGGVTLHYTVSVDQVKRAPHTCHYKEGLADA
jgi:hypothetical protein